MARIEHFALIVNTKTCDARITKRAATTYLMILYQNKLKPLLYQKQTNSKNEYASKFRKLIEKLKKSRISDEGTPIGQNFSTNQRFKLSINADSVSKKLKLFTK